MVGLGCRQGLLKNPVFVLCNGVFMFSWALLLFVVPLSCAFNVWIVVTSQSWIGVSVCLGPVRVFPSSESLYSQTLVSRSPLYALAWYCIFPGQYCSNCFACTARRFPGQSVLILLPWVSIPSMCIQAFEGRCAAHLGPNAWCLLYYLFLRLQLCCNELQCW